MLAPIHFAFVQRGLLELLLLSIPAGLLGTWIVLRGLTFYSHAVGTAAFPGLVVADGLALSGPLCAFVAAILFAAGVERLARRRDSGHDSLTALVLVGALATGVILASDVFHSGAAVESLLFGSVLLIGPHDIVLAGLTAAVAVACSAVVGRRWLAVGFDPSAARALGARSALPDALLLGLVALTVIAALSAVGALLATALVVVPAATMRLLGGSVLRWQLRSVALAAAEGAAGLWLAVRLNAPPGAAIALVGGALFACVWAVQRLPERRRTWGLAGLAAGGAALVALAGIGWTNAPAGGLPVVATTTQIADWTRRVAGPDASVHQILRPNTDPHEYEPRPKDVERTRSARVVFENGDRLDGWMAHVVAEAGGRPDVVVLGHAVPVRLPGPNGSTDPHWWHDPRNAEAAVGEIRDALAAADPAHRRGYERRAAAYTARLRSLDRGIAACLGRVPAARRKLVTDHDAFGYFARRYGIRIVGAVIPSQTTQAQPSAGDMARLARIVRREHVRSVFPETSLNARLAKAVAAETGASADHTVYGDTLGPRDSAGGTYLGMEAANADSMDRGFGGQGCRIETGS